MIEDTWLQLLADERVDLGSLARSKRFRRFVEQDVAEILEEYRALTMTFELWIEIQYRIAEALASISTGTQNCKIAALLSGYKNVELFLAVRDTTQDGYALQLRGWSAEEYDGILRSSLTVDELYQANPVAFFGPLLKTRRGAKH